MSRLTPQQRAKVREIEARWEQPQRVSRFGNGIKAKMEQMMEDLAHLLVYIEALDE